MATYSLSTNGDTSILQDPTYANTNYGNLTVLQIGRWSSGYSMRALCAFDFSSISSSEVCDSAILSLWLNHDYSSNDCTWKVYRVKRQWLEMQATWNQYISGASWQTAGAMGANDIDLTELGTSSTISASATAGTEIQISLNTAEVQKMYDGTYPNYGFLIKATSETSVNLWYVYSLQAGTNIPKITIETHLTDFRSRTFQPSLFDNHMFDGEPQSNYSTATVRGIGSYLEGSGYRVRGLFIWDFTPIYPTETCLSATMSLWVYSNYLSSGSDLWNVYRLKRDWMNAQSCWNNYTSGSAWETAGATGGSDIDITELGSVYISASATAGTEIQISLNTAEVQKMYDGTYPNYGFLIKATSEYTDINNYVGIYSNNYATTSKTPKLYLYTQASGSEVYDAYTKALLHFDGTNNSYYFRDEIQNNWTAYRYPSTSGSGAIIKTDQYKFGTASGYFAGSALGDWIQTGTQFDFGSDDWTADFWIRPNPDDGFCGLFGYEKDTDNYWGAGIYSASGLSFLTYAEKVSGSIISHWYDPDTTLTINDWQHIAYVKSGSYVKAYVNGTTTANFPCSLTMPVFSPQTFKIGKVGGQYDFYRGYIDEFRLSNTARWTSNFTPPNAPYAPESPPTTQAFYRQPFMYSGYPWM